jgi:creatinine amidohydrolase
MFRVASQIILVCILLIYFTGKLAYAQEVTESKKIPIRWDELSYSDWQTALEKSNYTCILPIGILEKHGQGLPIGSDLIKARQWAARAAEQEYAVVFPDYFYGQINEAKHVQGTFALPNDLTMELLEATVAEIGRNGFKRIVLVNGHGGNPQMLRYFVQNQLESPRNYAVYFFEPQLPTELLDNIATLRKTDPNGYEHGGENEASEMLYLRPDLVQLDRSKNESGEDLKRLKLSPNLYTAIWWYASFPNHYAGKAELASTEIGKLGTDGIVADLVEALEVVKQDTMTLHLQQMYFEAQQN